MNPASRSYELLAPVGNMEMCLAAVHNGADAIYVGFPGFNARGRTVDHSWEALEEMISFCHHHQVKVFLALNVLIFEKELRQLLVDLPRALALGPDAFIVQDQGLARLIRFLCPTQVLHASTQMTVTNHEHIALTEDLGLQRYVLGREVSMEEMTLIRANTDKELEVFVHGALCVAYSGQCLTSEGFGGRSANRGQCAQSCRMEYDLMVDGERRDLGALRYLVSPKDLCGLEDIPKLIELGIDSFKIEGRLKTPQYVAASASAYKQAMNAALNPGNTLAPESPATQAENRRNLEVTYSRGFFHGWLGGVDHQRLVDGRYGSHRGSEIGTVLGLDGTILRISSRAPLRAGDGLLFVDYASAGKKPNTPAATWGARLFSAHQVHDDENQEIPHWDVTFSNDFRLNEVPVGAAAYLNDSPTVERQVTRTFTDKSLWKTSPLKMTMTGAAGAPLDLKVERGNLSVTIASKANLDKARNPATALTAEKAAKEAGALSGSGYRLEELRFDLEPGLFLSDKDLRKVRQEAIATFTAMSGRTEPVLIKSAEEAITWMETDALRESTNANLSAIAPPSPHLNLLIRETTSLDALAGLPLDTVYLDFEHGKDYRSAVAKVRSLGFKAGVVTTRILKPSEYHNLKVIESLAPDVVLVRNLGALHSLSGKGLNLIGDFSLNVTNSLTATYLMGKGLQTLCPAYDLNQWQLFDLLDAVGGRHFEVTVHQYLPSFHMEHCVFAAFLSKGSSFKDCGKPCESHRVELRDHTGALHPLKADQECRNTMFNGRPQSAARLVPGLMAKGIHSLRVEALYEDAETLRAKVLGYAGLVTGTATPEAVFTNMGVVERYGVMEGQIRNPNVYQDRKKKI